MVTISNHCVPRASAVTPKALWGSSKTDDTTMG